LARIAVVAGLRGSYEKHLRKEEDWQDEDFKDLE